MTIAPDRELDRSPGGNFTNHAAKLQGAFDALPIDLRHHVVFLKPRFCRRAVRNDGTNNYAAFGGKLQLLGGFARDFVKFHAEPAGVLPVEQSHRSVVVTGQRRESFELIDGLAVFGESHLRGNERVEFRRLLVAPREFCL